MFPSSVWLRCRILACSCKHFPIQALWMGSRVQKHESECQPVASLVIKLAAECYSTMPLVNDSKMILGSKRQESKRLSLVTPGNL